jgi:P-type Ca2+ transporter type 2C
MRAVESVCVGRGHVRLCSAPSPGRVRLAVDGLRRRPERQRDIATRLRSLPGVHAANPSTLTGNVLLEYDAGRWTPTTLLVATAEALGLDAQPRAPHAQARAPHAQARAPHAQPDSQPRAVPVAPGNGGVLVRSWIPGRIRLVVPGLRRAPELEQMLEAPVRNVPGVQLARASAWTGTLLVLFDPAQCNVEQVVATAFDAAKSMPPARTPAAGRRAPLTPAYPTAQLSTPPAQPEVDWHAQDTAVAAHALGVDPARGLSATEADRRRRVYGPNRMPVPEEPSLMRLLSDQLLNAPTALLAAGAAISIVTGGLLEAALITTVLGANAVAGAVTERTGHRAIAALRRSASIRARVRRDGHDHNVEADELVPGDVVKLLPGDPVPADARIIEVHHLKVEESALTGESRPVDKSERRQSAHLALADRQSMVFRGTTIVSGSGLALVVATGDRTALGRLHLLAAEADAPPTPLERDLDRLGRWLAVGAGSICAAVLGLGVLRGAALRQSLEVAVSLGVAAIPEGLTALATSVLALASGRMRRKGTLIRTLGAAEALGSVTVVCADKTGTLTENRMAVRELYTAAGTVRITGPALRLVGGLEPGDQSGPHRALVERALQVGVLCSDADLVMPASGEIEVDGSATEGALLIAAAKAGLDPGAMRARYPRSDLRERSDGRRHMVTVHRLEDRTLALMKGSPEEVVAMCDTLASPDGDVAFNEAIEQAIGAANASMAGRAMRVLALAERVLNSGYSPDELGRGYTFLGLIGLVDPVRAAVPAAVEALRGAGIRTVMITGDQALTATAVARELGLDEASALQVLEAGDLAALDSQTMRGLVRDVQVFARVPPEMKLAIVRALQANGQIVAMTGDGVNDGPALRAAEVGVAMGQHGTELARELADVVLSTDDFSLMADAVEEGRLVRANIRRVLHYLLSTNASEVWVVAGAVAAGLPSPLTPLQLLWLNLVTDIAPGLGLALEPREPDLMRQPPRDPREPIITRPLLHRIAAESGMIAAGALASYALGIARHGRGPIAQTMAFASLVGAQLLHVPLARAGSAPAAAGRRPANPPLALGVGLSAALQLVALFVPPVRAVLGGASLGLADLGIAVLGAVLPIVAIEADRRARSRKLP